MEQKGRTPLHALWWKPPFMICVISKKNYLYIQYVIHNMFDVIFLVDNALFGLKMGTFKIEIGKEVTPITQVNL